MIALEKAVPDRDGEAWPALPRGQRREDLRLEDLRGDFLEEDLREVDFFVDVLRAADFFVEDFCDFDLLAVDLRADDLVDLRAPPLRAAGTLPPARRASESPMAMACLRLVTFLPEPPLRNVPRLRSRMAFATLAWAFFPYFAMPEPRVSRLPFRRPLPGAPCR